MYKRIIITTVFLLNSAAAYGSDPDYYVSIGIPYFLRTNIETKIFYDDLGINADYRLGFFSQAFRGTVFLERKNEVTIGLGVEKGVQDVMTHSISYPYNWLGLVLEAKKRKQFGLGKSRFGWYVSGSLAVEERKYYERDGQFVKTTRELAPAVAVGVVMKIF